MKGSVRREFTNAHGRRVPMYTHPAFPLSQLQQPDLSQRPQSLVRRRPTSAQPRSPSRPAQPSYGGSRPASAQPSSRPCCGVGPSLASRPSSSRGRPSSAPTRPLAGHREGCGGGGYRAFGVGASRPATATPSTRKTVSAGEEGYPPHPPQRSSTSPTRGSAWAHGVVVSQGHQALVTHLVAHTPIDVLQAVRRKRSAGGRRPRTAGHPPAAPAQPPPSPRVAAAPLSIRNALLHYQPSKRAPGPQGYTPRSTRGFNRPSGYSDIEGPVVARAASDPYAVSYDGVRLKVLASDK